MMKYFLYTILLFCVVSTSFASGRYPSGDVTEPSKKEEVVCKCDPQIDPCCIPPVGGSSKSTETDKSDRSDTATCQCDPKTDPCCKQVKGTKLDKDQSK